MATGIKVQVVDDSLLMRNKMIRIVEDLNYTVIAVATGGEEAINQYEEAQPDVVIMDIAMPNMSGLEAVEQMVAKYPDAKVIMVSALNQKKMVIEALQKGAKHFIIKPFKRNSLKETVEMVLSDLESED